MADLPGCPSCNQRSNRVIYTDGAIKLRRCSACDLVFTDPMIAVDPTYYQEHVVYAHKTISDAQGERAHLDSRRIAWMEALTKRGSKTLDIGCGSGAFVACSRDAGRDAYGIDFNDREISLGRTAFHLDGFLMTSDVLSMPDEWSGFDLITMFEVIEHLPNPKQMIQEVHRRLKDGGYLVLSCPNERRWQPAGRIFVDYPPHHLTRWTPKCIQLFLESNSFEYVKTEIDGSLRDILWTAYVNWRARSKSVTSAPAQKAKRSSNWKWALDRVLRIVCLPFDALLKILHIGTMGMRVVARKPSYGS